VYPIKPSEEAADVEAKSDEAETTFYVAADAASHSCASDDGAAAVAAAVVEADDVVVVVVGVAAAAWRASLPDDHTGGLAAVERPDRALVGEIAVVAAGTAAVEFATKREVAVAVDPNVVTVACETAAVVPGVKIAAAAAAAAAGCEAFVGVVLRLELGPHPAAN